MTNLRRLYDDFMIILWFFENRDPRSQNIGSISQFEWQLNYYDSGANSAVVPTAMLKLINRLIASAVQCLWYLATNIRKNRDADNTRSRFKSSFE